MPISPQLGPAVAAIFFKYFAESSVGKLKIGGSFDLIGSGNRTCSVFIQYIENVGNLSKIGVHKSNCCLKKWAEE